MYEAILPLRCGANGQRTRRMENIRGIEDIRGKALGALAIGAMIGALVAVPYDQLFGLSSPLCTALQSLIATAALVSAGAVEGAELTLQTDRLPPDRAAPDFGYAGAGMDLAVSTRCQVSVGSA